MPNKPLTRGEYARSHRKDILLMAAAWIILAIGVTWSLYSQQTLLDQNESARLGVCALKHDLEVRIDSGEHILNDPHAGEEVYGIPRSVIEQNLANQKRTLKALEVVKCD